MMPLINWFENAGIDPYRDLVLWSVASDGLNFKKSRPLAVSLLREGRALILYIEGGDAEGSQEYTNIDPDVYRRKQITCDEADEKVRRFTEGSSGTVSYRVNKYSRPFLEKVVSSDLVLPVLDINHVIAAQEAEFAPPLGKKDFGHLCRWYHNRHLETGEVNFTGAVEAFGLSRYSGLPITRARLIQLDKLWRAVLLNY